MNITVRGRSSLPSATSGPAEEDRRVSLRRRVLKNASIVFRQGYCSIRCRILNLSESGALLEPIDPTWCPNEFLLKPDIGDPRHCEVAWRRDRHLAVRFLDGLGSPVPLPPREAAALLPASERIVSGQARGGSIDPTALGSGYGALLILSVASVQPVSPTVAPEVSRSVLDALEDRLRSALRGYDTVARLRDGHRFAVVLRDCDAIHVPAVAKRLIKAASSEPVPTRDVSVDVLLSISVSIPPVGTSLSQMIVEALPELADNVGQPEENPVQPSLR